MEKGSLKAQSKTLKKVIWLPAWLFGTLLEKRGCARLAQAGVESSLPARCDLVPFPRHSSARRSPLGVGQQQRLSFAALAQNSHHADQGKGKKDGLKGNRSNAAVLPPVLFVFPPADQRGAHRSLSHERTQFWI